MQRRDRGRCTRLVVRAIAVHNTISSSPTPSTSNRQIKTVRLPILSHFPTFYSLTLSPSHQDSLFSDYRIQSNANNEINLLLSPEALLQALKSAQSGSEVVMKLAKKHGHAVLAFEIALALGGGGGGGLSAFASGRRAQLAHDVLIDVLRPADMEKLKEPLCPEPDVRCLSTSRLNVQVCEE